MKTTLRKIYSHNPCRDGFAKLVYSMTGDEKYNQENPDSFIPNVARQFLPLSDEIKDKEVTVLQILESNGVQDAFWVLRTQEYLDYCLILADVAESVLPLYEKNNHNSAPREAIQAIRDYKAGTITKEKLNHFKRNAAAAAAYAAAYAASAAAAAAYAAAYAAYAARKTQWKINETILRQHLEDGNI